jgi:hypothetical protein
MMLDERLSVQQTKTNLPKHMSNASHYSTDSRRKNGMLKMNKSMEHHVSKQDDLIVIDRDLSSEETISDDRRASFDRRASLKIRKMYFLLDNPVQNMFWAVEKSCRRMLHGFVDYQFVNLGACDFTLNEIWFYINVQPKNGIDIR